MTMTIEIGKGRTIAITPEQLATLHGFPVIQNKMDEIALKNILSDANAGVGKREDFASNDAWADAAHAMSMKKLESMLRGEYRGGGERGPRVSADPIAAEALRLARVFVGLKAKGDGAADRLLAVAQKLELKQNDDSSAEFEKRIKNEWVRAYAAKPETIAEATDNVAKATVRIADDIGL